jgi:hypothetical protein
MKDILFIAHYDHENSYDSLALSSQLINNNINILHIFTDQQISNLYHKYCYIQNKNYIKCLSNRSNSRISMTVSEYKNLYKKFFFLNTTKIIINNSDIKLDSSDQPICIKDLGYILSLQNIIDFDRKFFTYEDIFSDTLISQCVVKDKVDNIINLKNRLKPITDKENQQQLSMISIAETKPISNENNFYYEDHDCIFAIFEERNFGLVKSPAYFNKNNNKIYSLRNNCLGNVTKYSSDQIFIEWSINTEKFNTLYSKNSNNMYI